MRIRIITAFLFALSINFALFKKETELEFKNKILDYYKKGDLNEEEIKAFKNIIKTKFESFELNNINDLTKACMKSTKSR